MHAQVRDYLHCLHRPPRGCAPLVEYLYFTFFVFYKTEHLSWSAMLTNVLFSCHALVFFISRIFTKTDAHQIKLEYIEQIEPVFCFSSYSLL